MRAIILLLFVTFCLDTFCQTKPIPANDTFVAYQGITNVSQVLWNDKGDNKIVTSFRILPKTTVYTAGKIAKVDSFGTVRIDSSGKLTLEYTGKKIGRLPEITYIVNNGLAGSGNKASVIITGRANPDSTLIFPLLGKLINTRNGPLKYKDASGTEFYCSLGKANTIQGTMYYVIVNINELWMIDKLIYDWIIELDK